MIAHPPSHIFAAVCRRSSGVEQRIRNAWVGGSIPLDGTISLKKAAMDKKLKIAVRIIVAAVVFAVAAAVLYNKLAELDYRLFKLALDETRLWQALACLAATVISFMALAAYEVSAAHIVMGRKFYWGTAACVGAICNALANTLGFHALTASAVRYRFYKRKGLSNGDTARIMSLASTGIMLGFAAIIAIALLNNPPNTGGWGMYAGMAMVLALGGFVAWLHKKPRTITFVNWVFIFPDSKGALLQMLIGLVEMTAAIAALYFLLPASSETGFFEFGLVYIGAVILGMISGVPGGLGIFEVTMLSVFPDGDKSGLMAALLLYRLIYNILPFCLGLAATLFFEIRTKPRQDIALNQ